MEGVAIGVLVKLERAAVDVVIRRGMIISLQAITRLYAQFFAYQYLNGLVSY